MAANEWFTTPADRAESRGRVDLARTSSPGAIAGHILARFRLQPPLITLALSAAELVAWTESVHGGWCELDPRLRGMPFDAASLDVTSCYPLLAHALGWWHLISAETVKRRTVTAALRRLCTRAIDDPTVALDPAVWARFGFTLVEVIPDGEPFPIEIDDAHRPDGRLEIVPIWSPQRHMYYAWPDFVAAAVRSGRVPNIVRAVKLEPVGRQPNLRKRVPFLPGVTLDAGHDPALPIVRARRAPKTNGDRTLAAELHAVVNALVFGIFWRFDPTRRTDGRSWRDTEVPGPWNCMPIAATVSAGAHLLLAVFDELVAERGSIVAYRDTDSSIVPASPEGGALTLVDGTTVCALSWCELDMLVEQFAPLAPGAEWPVWKIPRGDTDRPLQALVFAPKRHVEYLHRQDDAIEIVACTEAQLGGTCADPPTMRGRRSDGYRRWSVTAIEREIRYAIDHQTNPDALRPPAPWDRPGDLPFPAIRRYIVKTPEAAARLPTALGGRPGTRYLETRRNRDVGGADQTFVALDPGGDLSNWQQLAWFCTAGAKAERVTTDSADYRAALLDTLDYKAARWCRPSPTTPISGVTVDADQIRTLGRVSGVIDADTDGLDDLASRPPVHEEANQLAVVHNHASRLGKRAFARLTGLSLTTAGRAARGEPISKRSITRALSALKEAATERVCAAPECETRVSRAGALYCSTTCRERVKKQRGRASQVAMRPLGVTIPPSHARGCRGDNSAASYPRRTQDLRAHMCDRRRWSAWSRRRLPGRRDPIQNRRVQYRTVPCETVQKCTG